jgi:hypothetical protein
MSNNFLVPKSIIERVLGPTADELGKDVLKLYKMAKNLILQKAFKKLKNPNDGKRANLRVARDVLWNGSFTDDVICAEYFGGILASSRSEDGKDDSGIFFLDIIKSLSSSQLKMHYIIYRTLNKILVANEDKKTLNPGNEIEIRREKIFFSLFEIAEEFKNKDFGFILHGLHFKGLIGFFQTKEYKLNENESFAYLEVEPTSLGVQLFAIANNMLEDWRKFSTVDFGDFEEIILPQHYAQSLDHLLKKLGLSDNAQNN